MNAPISRPRVKHIKTLDSTEPKLFEIPTA